MRHRRPLLSDGDSTKDLWPSFTDITSTIALILFVLVLLAYVRNLVSSKRVHAYELQIRSSEAALRQLEAKIAVGNAQLSMSNEKLRQQQEIIANSSRELDGLRSRLQNIAVLRVEILEKVKRSIEKELSPTGSQGGELVLISDSGNIVINERLLFEYNSAAIKKEGNPLLDTLSRALGNLLADASVRDNIDAILIQGHTDERGSASFNRDLSAKRANAVLSYLFDANKALQDSYGSYFASSAYSEFRPLNSAKTEAAYEQNRRIEISVVLKDANVRNVIDEYMQNLGPPSPTPPTVP